MHNHGIHVYLNGKQITVSTLADECAVQDLGAMAVSSADATRDGAWTSSCSAANRPGRYAKFHSFTLAEPAHLIVELVSSVDTYLLLLEGVGTDGRVLRRNDDSRDDDLGRRNSRIARNFAAGTYTAEATTYGSSMTGSFRLTVRTLPPAPDRPARVETSVGADDGLVTASWPASAGAARYRVTLSVSSYSATVDAPSTSHTYPASALASRSGRRSAYVAACNAEGACSDRRSVSFIPPPAAPANLSAAADGSTEVDLTWRSVSDAEAYEAEYRQTAETSWTDADGSVETTSKSVTGLTCGTEYEFRVRAHGDGTDRASHWGPWSETANAETDECAANSPPVFDPDSYSFTIGEDAADESSVGFVTADDPDMDTLTYSISGTTHFEIDSSSGEITVDGSLAGRGGTTYTMTVTASDGVNTPVTLEIAITVDLGGFPALTAPTPEFRADGATVDVGFALPDRRFHYRLTFYRYESPQRSEVVSRHQPESGDTSHRFIINRLPSLTESYYVGIKACRDEFPDDSRCATEIKTAPDFADTVATVTLKDVADSVLQGGKSTTFAADVENLVADQTYNLEVQTRLGTVFRFDGCGDNGVDPKSFGDTSGVLGIDRSGIVVFACVSDQSDDEIYATLSIGDLQIKESNRIRLHTSPIPTPENLRANGRSNGLATGKATLKWDSLSGAQSDAAYGYEIRYGEECFADVQGGGKTGGLCGSSTPATWDAPTPAQTSSEHVFVGLEMDTLYRVAVRRTLNGVESGWSEPVFVFPTTGVPGDSVATIPHYGHLPHGDYSFVICEDTIPDSMTPDSQWISDIQGGIETWESTVRWPTGTQNLVEANPVAYIEGFCSYATHKVVFTSSFNALSCGPSITATYLLMAVLNTRTLGCLATLAYFNYLDRPVYPSNPITGSTMFLANDYDGWNPGIQSQTDSNCSFLHQFVMHEAGHAFGLGKFLNQHASVDASIMKSNVDRNFCSPQPYDVSAIMAVYQSR